MSNQSERSDPKGRSYEQVTKDGTGSAASVGTGGTGDIGRMSGSTGAGNSQSESRTDDWLSPGTEQEERQGFRPTDPESMKTGMEGINKLNREKTGNRQ